MTTALPSYTTSGDITLFGMTVPQFYADVGLTKLAVYKASSLKPKYFEDLKNAAQVALTEANTYAAVR